MSKNNMSPTNPFCTEGNRHVSAPRMETFSLAGGPLRTTTRYRNTCAPLAIPGDPFFVTAKKMAIPGSPAIPWSFLVFIDLRLFAQISFNPPPPAVGSWILEAGGNASIFLQLELQWRGLQSESISPGNNLIQNAHTIKAPKASNSSATSNGGEPEVGLFLPRKSHTKSPYKNGHSSDLPPFFPPNFPRGAS